MKVCAFTACENVLTNKCNGEVKILIHVAERYGILIEKAGERMEEICQNCDNYSPSEKNGLRYAKKRIARVGVPRL